MCDRLFGEAGIMKDLPTLPLQSLAADFPASCLSSLDSILSAIDERAFSHVDYVGKAEDLSIFGDESVEEIYACHILEHFRRADVLKVLQEWFRVLCTGGYFV